MAIAPGLEEALVAELDDLGVSAARVPGGARIRGDLSMVMAVNLWSHLAGRVTVEVATIPAASLEELAGGVRKLNWKDLVWPGQPLEVKVTTSGARLRRDLVSRKVEHAIADALRGPRLPGPRPPREPAGIGVHITGNRASLVVDSSGELLHRRGWRKSTAKAPMRENLAAAVLRVAQWSPGEPLADPMCGSGTFSIEAASIALGRAPGLARPFAFERWPCFDPAAWKQLRDEAHSAPPLDLEGPILASDRDAGAVQATEENATRARVQARIEVRHSALTDLEPPAMQGLMVINPPYGARVSHGRDIERLYQGVGRTIRDKWARWRVAVVVPTVQHARAFELGLKPLASFSNGGLGVVVCGAWVR